MSTYKPGPKELALKALREQNAEKRSKVSTSDLRNQVDQVKARPPKPRKAGKRARKA